MELRTFETLYRKMFLQTDGYVLNWPIGLPIGLGDFFTLKAGKIGIIGGLTSDLMRLNFDNLYDIEPLNLTVPAAEPENEGEHGIAKTFPSYPRKWNMKKGCYSDYKSNKMLHPYKHKWKAADVNQVITTFENESDFFFCTDEVSVTKILDFASLEDRIIRRLATQFFNYSEVYLITEVAYMNHFSLGVSNTAGAKMIASVDSFFNGDILELTSSEMTLEVERTKGLSYLKLREPGGTIAFKAMKMILSLKAKEKILRKLSKSEDKDVQKYIANLIDQDLHNLVPSIEINPSNASEFFDWRYMSMEDVELFLGLN